MTAEQLIALVPYLPSPAPSVTRLLNLLTRPDTDNDSAVGILRQDGVLSAKVLALCNSAAFGLAEPVGSLDQAILYLGHTQLHRLMMAVSFGGALSPALPGYVIEDSALWRHSLLTALLSETVQRKVKMVKTDLSVAYTAGLIHDIGKLVISHALNASKQSCIVQLIERGSHSLLEAEREVMGSDHAEIGACLLRHWNLPDILTEAVANHHKPPMSPKLELSAVVHVADMIAHEAGSAPGIGGFAVRSEEAVVEKLGLNRRDIEGLIVSAYDSALEVEQTLSAK